MDHSAEAAVPVSIVAGALVFLLMELAVVAVAVNRISRGLPVLPYARRRPVPWRAFHVGVLAAAHLVLIAIAQRIALGLYDTRLPDVNVSLTKRETLSNPLVVLLDKSHTLPTLLLCLLAAVIVAPIVEEFLFRLVLQGWLEAVETRSRRRIRALRKLTLGVLPVVLVAMLFAGIHYRRPQQEIDPALVACVLAAQVAAGFALLALGVGFLRWDARARTDDLGLVPGKLLADVRLGVLTFLAVAPVVYLLKIDLSVKYGENVADPLALFPFALTLGVLYCRTHRLVPCVVLHMSLNFTSLMLAWLRLGA